MKRVPPSGLLSSEIAFVGQSPGRVEQELKKPFVGPAGKVLRNLCKEVGINPDDAYWTNVCDRILLGTEAPTEEDISEGRVRLRHELKKLTNLKIIVLVGIPASQLVFRGLMREMSGQEGELFGHPCTAIYHPSATLRAKGGEQAQRIKKEIKFVLKKVKILSELKVNKTRNIITPIRRSGIAELLSSKPKSKDMVAPKCAQSVIPEPDNWLKNILDETLEKQQELWEKPADSFMGPYFRGSEVSDPCLRSLVLSVMGQRLPIEAKLRRIFNTGLSIEEVNVQTMIKAGLVNYEDRQLQVIYKNPPILGHIDAPLFYDDAAYLCEIKSINEYAFKKLPKEHGLMLAGQSPLFQTHYKYIMQWNCYAGAPNMHFDNGFILFEEKNTSVQKFYWLKRDDELLEKMLTRLRLAAPYILSDPMRIPPKSINETSKLDHDVYCPRKYLCNKIPDKGATFEQVRELDRKLRG